MPARKRAQSKTVDLVGFTESELFALLEVAWPMRNMDILPHSALHAMERFQIACARMSRRPGADLRRRVRFMGLVPDEPQTESVSKIPRESLQAFADAIRPMVKPGAAEPPGIETAIAKLDARLQAKPGRPGEPMDEWQQRAEDVRRTARAIKKKRKGSPIDSEVETVLGLTPGTLRNWRRRHRDLFPPFT